MNEIMSSLATKKKLTKCKNTYMDYELINDL